MSASARAQDRAAREGSACPLCGGHATPAFGACDLNRATDNTRFLYARCGSCGTYFLVEPPTDLSPYYPQTYYSHLSVQDLDAHARAQHWTVQLLLDHVIPGRLVEIGPGEGVFARAARNAGFDVTAIEMDAGCCEYLRSVAEVDAINSSAPEDVLPTLPPSRAIAMWQVIEHLRHPWAAIENAAANLERDGVLVVASPNPHALQFRLLRRRWAHLDAPRHLFLIPPDALARRCAQLGLRLAATTTADPSGRHWNRFGWQYALRRAPRSRPETRAGVALSAAMARLARPLEERGQNGCSYTSVFVKSAH
jgi:Methyltransferase domain